jgi:hypothetical protein
MYNLVHFLFCFYNYILVSVEIAALRDTRVIRLALLETVVRSKIVVYSTPACLESSSFSQIKGSWPYQIPTHCSTQNLL